MYITDIRYITDKHSFLIRYTGNITEIHCNLIRIVSAWPVLGPVLPVLSSTFFRHFLCYALHRDLSKGKLCTFKYSLSKTLKFSLNLKSFECYKSVIVRIQKVKLDQINLYIGIHRTLFLL